MYDVCNDMPFKSIGLVYETKTTVGPSESEKMVCALRKLEYNLLSILTTQSNPNLEVGCLCGIMVKVLDCGL